MIFVGGPLHGQDIQVPLVQQPGTKRATLPAQHAGPHGQAWHLVPVQFLPNHPITGQPTGHGYQQFIYVHPGLRGAAPGQFLPLLTEAVMQAWWAAGQPLAPAPATPANGARTTYIAQCENCPDEPGSAGQVHLFASITERAGWARQHIDSNPGHRMAFSIDQAMQEEQQ